MKTKLQPCDKQIHKGMTCSNCWDKIWPASIYWEWDNRGPYWQHYCDLGRGKSRGFSPHRVK